MGARLVREVIRTMPAAIKPNEWKLVVVLADALDNDTREGTFPGGQRALCARMGTSDDSIRRSLNRLRDQGHELRIPIGKRPDGSPLFAVHGSDTTYRIPVF